MKRAYTSDDFRSALEKRIDECLSQWQIASIPANSCGERLYLWFTRADGEELAGSLWAAAGGGLGELVTPEAIPSDRDRNGVRAWIVENTRRLPILNPNL